jgi:uncharacterized protein YbaP (TraB family)
MYWQFPGTNVRVLGSMHMLPISNLGLPDWAIEAFEWSEALVFESDPPAILPYLRASSPPNLKQELKSATWEALRAHWPTSGPLPPVEDTRPWAILLFSAALAQRAAHGIESQFMQWAAEQSKPVHFLESAEAVASAFDSAPAAEIREALELLTSDLSAPQRSLEAMYSAWMRGDLSALVDVANKSPTFQFPGLKHAVLQRRNLEWSPALRQLMSSSKRTLVAVGALHLHGPGNAIECVGQIAELFPLGGLTGLL